MNLNNNLKTPVKMKNFTLSRLIAMLLLVSSLSSAAQNYNFTLVDNGNYSFTVAAESLFDSGSFQPITQSFGFVLVLPDGITITVDQVFPTGTSVSETPIDGSSVSGVDPTMADNDLVLITTDTAGRTINAHTNGATIPLMTITVNGSPTMGEIRLLDNNSVLANALNPSLDAFFQVDIVDDSNVIFNNEFNMLGSSPAFQFNPLSVDDVDQVDTDIALYPNPAKEEFEIRATGLIIDVVEIYDLNGRLVSKFRRPSSKINVSTLEDAIYMVVIRTDKGYTIRKLVKE